MLRSHYHSPSSLCQDTRTIPLLDAVAHFLKQITTTDVEISAQIMSTIAIIMQQIPRWEDYLRLYPVSIQVHKAIAKLYSEIINFTIRSAKLQRRQGFGKFITGPVVLVTPAHTNLQSAQSVLSGPYVLVLLHKASYRIL